MVKEQMARASQLIKAKQYSEARKLLKTIDHPKAKEWLGKLDQIAPEKKRTPLALRILLLLGGAAGVIMLVLALVTFVNYRRYLDEHRDSTRTDLYLYCDYTTLSGSAQCEAYAQRIVANDGQLWSASICGGIFGVYSDTDAYGRCLARANIPLP